MPITSGWGAGYNCNGAVIKKKKKRFVFEHIYPCITNFDAHSFQKAQLLDQETLHYTVGHRELNNLESKRNHTLPSGTCLDCSLLTREAQIEGNS